MLSKIELTMAAIRTKLLEDETMRKLLFHDSNNALNMLAPSKVSVEQYITLKPVLEFENKNEYNQNSMINIYLTDINPIDDVKACSGVLQVNVVCNTGVWELLDNKIRPLQLSNRIIKLIHGCKFNVSNKLVLATISDLIINKKMIGYALLFDITDGSGNNDNF